MELTRQHAERLRLARVLDVPPDRLDFLSELRASDLATLRSACFVALQAPHRALHQRLARISKLLPTTLAAHIAEHTIGPLLCARISAEMSIPRTVAMCQYLSPPFMAEVTLHMDMGRLTDLAAELPLESLRAITGELLARNEFITLGELVDLMPTPIVTRVASEIANAEAMLRLSQFIQSPLRLQALLEKLPPLELRALARAATDARLGLLPQALFLLQRLRPMWQRRFIDMVIAEGETTLESLVREMARFGLWSMALPFSALLDRTAQHKLVTLPVWRDEGLLREALRGTEEPTLRPYIQALLAGLPAERLEYIMSLLPRQQAAPPAI